MQLSYLTRFPEPLLTKVVLVFGAAQPHHAYLFANARGSRLKIFIQDGYGMWMCTRRLAEGTFSWPRDIKELKHSLSREQLQALVAAPWQRAVMATIPGIETGEGFPDFGIDRSGGSSKVVGHG